MLCWSPSDECKPISALCECSNVDCETSNTLCEHVSALGTGANKQREGVVRERVLGELSLEGGSKGREEGFHGSAGGSRMAFLPCEGGVTGFPASLGVFE